MTKMIHDNQLWYSLDYVERLEAVLQEARTALEKCYKYQDTELFTVISDINQFKVDKPYESGALWGVKHRDIVYRYDKHKQDTREALNKIKGIMDE